MSKRILILGATGRTGKQAVPLALAKGYEVVALVRDAAKLIPADRLTIVLGSPTHMEDVRKAMKDCDAVISLLAPLPHGAALSIRKIDRPRIIERSIANVLQVMP